MYIFRNRYRFFFFFFSFTTFTTTTTTDTNTQHYRCCSQWCYPAVSRITFQYSQSFNFGIFFFLAKCTKQTELMTAIVAAIIWYTTYFLSHKYISLSFPNFFFRLLPKYSIIEILVILLEILNADMLLKNYLFFLFLDKNWKRNKVEAFFLFFFSLQRNISWFTKIK